MQDKTLESLIADITRTLESRPLQPVQMPMPWAAHTRAMPIEFIAAAVFTAQQRGETPERKNLELVGEWNGYRLHMKGRRLTQTHAEVWQAIMEIAKWRVAGDKVVFTSSHILRALGRDTDRESRKQLHEWITDMQTCLVEITMPSGRPGYGWSDGYGASLIPEAAFRRLPNGAREYSLVLHEVLCQAFARGYSLTEHASRKRLGRNDLALWMHQYLAAFPGPVPIATLQSLSGAPESQRAADFRRRLVQAMKALEREGIVASWRLAKLDAEQLIVEQAKSEADKPKDRLSLVEILQRQAIR